jgi:hypothetical protein
VVTPIFYITQKSGYWLQLNIGCLKLQKCNY